MINLEAVWSASQRRKLMPAAPCEHHKPGTYVRPDLIAGYAEVGLTCVHGYMVYTVGRPGPDPSSPKAIAVDVEPVASLMSTG